jgi:hypothetical protein
MSNKEPNIGAIALVFFGLIVVVRTARKLNEPRAPIVRVQRQPLTTRPRKRTTRP